MKNRLSIDFDTERDATVKIYKDREEGQELDIEKELMKDYFTLLETLIFMGYMMVENGISTKEQFTEATAGTLVSAFMDGKKSYKAQIITPDEPKDEQT